MRRNKRKNPFSFRLFRLIPFVSLSLFFFLPGVAAQTGADIIERRRAELQQQAASPEMKRERGTLPEDWVFALPEGVRSRQVTFYSDRTPCYGRIFFPKGFDPRGKRPAVIVGHGINAQAVGIEKYAARFAQRGLVAMAIDYRTYGYSGGDVLLLEPDTTTDERAVWEKEARIKIKRTNLNNFRETEDFRAAISFIQTEPGVDADAIGVWGSSNGASVVLMAAATDARIKAVVAQVGGAGGLGAVGPVAVPPQMIEDGVKRARTGQGDEVDGGFSFRSKIDRWSSQVNREFRPAALIDRVPETTKILWLPVEKDELIPQRGVIAASKAFKGVSQVLEIPYLTHFQAYSYAGFEVGSNIAADWFLKYLGDNGAPNPVEKTSLDEYAARRPQRRTAAASPGAYARDAVAAKDVRFFSEGIECRGRLFTPKDFSVDGKVPAVVLAPGRGETASMIEEYAAYFASRGLAAMAIDYRGWGRSGGFVYTAEPVKTDDRLRFSQLTARVRIYRKRIAPQQQMLDIRNALYFLQGEPGIDRARIGVWGADLAGGHAVAIAAADARIRAIVAHTPWLAGQNVQKRAWAPEMLRAEQHRARTGEWPRGVIDWETRAALAEYHPFRYVEEIPSSVAVLFVVDEKEQGAKQTAQAAARLLKGKNEVVGASGAALEKAADWLLSNL
ncbi:MAG: acetylxylan esterase [Blastocatellales bacterium]|nr:acetylxylan esterase [Blastocatellales bacterium]